MTLTVTACQPKEKQSKTKESSTTIEEQVDLGDDTDDEIEENDINDDDNDDEGDSYEEIEAEYTNIKLKEFKHEPHWLEFTDDLTENQFREYVQDFVDKLKSGKPEFMNFLEYTEDSKKHFDKWNTILSDPEAKQVFIDYVKNLKMVWDKAYFDYWRKDTGLEKTFTLHVENDLATHWFGFLNKDEIEDILKLKFTPYYNKDTFLPKFNEVRQKIDKEVGNTNMLYFEFFEEDGFFKGKAGARIGAAGLLQDLPFNKSYDSDDYQWDFHPVFTHINSRIDDFIDLNSKDDNQSKQNLKEFVKLHNEGKIKEAFEVFGHTISDGVNKKAQSLLNKEGLRTPKLYLYEADNDGAFGISGDMLIYIEDIEGVRTETDTFMYQDIS